MILGFISITLAWVIGVWYAVVATAFMSLS